MSDAAGPGAAGQTHPRGHHPPRPAPHHQRGRAHGVRRHHQVKYEMSEYADGFFS